jgi:ribosome biogenesis GTPase A
VIDDDLNYSKNMINFIKEQNLLKLKTKYNSISVIGCQSSGKSTLLNMLFGTSFDVMDQELTGR